MTNTLESMNKSQRDLILSQRKTLSLLQIEHEKRKVEIDQLLTVLTRWKESAEGATEVIVRETLLLEGWDPYSSFDEDEAKLRAIVTAALGLKVES